MALLIADISSHQEDFNAEKMKKIGVKGVLIRAGYRGSSSGKIGTDERYKTFISRAVNAGLPVGVYWWTQSLSNDEAKAEADACMALVKGIKLSFPIFLDIEFYNSKRQGRADKISSTRRTEYAITFLERCKACGYDAGVYCNPDFWKGNLISAKLQNYPRWIAHYGKSATMDCDMWQFTSSAKGSTYGVKSKYIDLSYMYTNFISGKKTKFAEPAPGEKSNNGKSEVPSKKEKFVGYVSANALNVRVWAGSENDTVNFSPLKKGTAVSVCDSVKDKDGDIWYYIKYKGKFGFCSASYISKKKIEEEPVGINYLAESAKWMKTIYDKIVEIGCRHKSGADTYEEIVKKRATTCTTTITAVFVKIGLLKPGKHINHKAAVGGDAAHILKKKNSILKSMTGYENLDKKKCDVYYVGAKNWASLPSRYKVAGAAYIQDSNGFMCQGKDKNGRWVNRSCNNSGSQVKADKKGVKRYYNNTMIESGYTFKSPILVVIIPKSK